MLIHFALLGWMQTKHGNEVAITVSQTMDLLEASDTQSLFNSLHEFLEYKKCLQWFNDLGERTQGFIKIAKVWLYS